MNKVTAFIIVALVLVLGYWSYTNYSTSPYPAYDTSSNSMQYDYSNVPSSVEQEVDAIDLGEDVDASMQEIDSDLNTL